MNENHGGREIKFRDAISEATVQAMERDPRIVLLGVGINDCRGVFGTTLEPAKQFGKKRVFDVPLSENAITGVAIGAAMTGLHPLLVHARNDFLLLTMDQLINNAAKWSYMTNGQLKVPLVIRAIIGRGWGQAAQHSQSLQALFSHIPGLTVVMPSGPYEAKGLLAASLEHNAPVIFLEHRWLHEKIGAVPADYYTLPLGKARILKKGKDLTLVAISHMVWEAWEAIRNLEREGIDVELIDPQTLSPLDLDCILESVKKTGHLLLADTSHTFCGVSAEIAAGISEKAFPYLRSSIQRIGLPFVPTPCGASLEKKFYPNAGTIEHRIRAALSGVKSHATDTDKREHLKEFEGPF